LAKYPLLSALFSDAAIKLVDIGGRGAAFAQLVPLAPVADYYVSEPDQAEANRLRAQLPVDAPWRSVTVLSEAIASQRGQAPLYVTRRAGMSSLLEPDPEVIRRFYKEKSFRVVAVTPVPTIPLDEAASQYGFADATFLKLDTQGTELDILRSGAALVRGSLLGVHTESLFQPFYKGQSLFADVDSHLRQNGFSLFSLNRTSLRRSHYRESLYSKRVITWAHCLYLREPDTLLSRNRETLRKDLPRLLALALTFSHFDLAWEIVTIGRRVHVFVGSDLKELASEIRQWCRIATSHIVQEAQERGLADSPMAPSVRDKSQLE
jgi:FkbM family methyltransferase